MPSLLQPHTHSFLWCHPQAELYAAHEFVSDAYERGSAHLSESTPAVGSVSSSVSPDLSSAGDAATQDPKRLPFGGATLERFQWACSVCGFRCVCVYNV
jgi:hypothetical protein